MVTLFTDTDTDITLEVAKEYGYKLISMPYSIDGKEIYPYEDFKTFDYKAFYDKLREGVLPKTSAIAPQNYIKYFEEEFKKGNDILYVHFSKAMSGTFNAMNIALDELKEKYPDRKFYAIDTKGITIMSYIIVREIGDMFNNGATIDEVMEWSKTNIDHYATYFYSTDLQFFKNSGRISNFAATFGSILGIHPIIYMGSDGQMTSVGKAKGRRKANEALISYVEKLGDDIKNHRIIIGHADYMTGVNELIDMLKAKYGDDIKVEVVPVNPTAGSHCGPNTVGIAFHSTSRE